MSMLDIHAEALNSISAAYHEFLLRYKASAEIVYGIVEGKDDPMFYRGVIERSLPDGWEVELISAGCKDNVIKATEAFDWKRFSPRRICFFVDRDLSDFMEDISLTAENLYVTDNYSIENDAVNFGAFKRILEEALNISGLRPHESDAIEGRFGAALASFREAMTPVMAQILVWRCEGKRPCLNDIRPKDFFIFRDGTIELRNGFESALSRLQNAANCVGLSAATEAAVAEAEVRFQEKQGTERLIRGKYLLWFMVEMALEIHRSISSLVARFTSPPKVRISLGAGNAMVILAPRVRCPKSLNDFLNRNYVQYIRERSLLWAPAVPAA
jgi:hypothetical protein